MVFQSSMFNLDHYPRRRRDPQDVYKTLSGNARPLELKQRALTPPLAAKYALILEPASPPTQLEKSLHYRFAEKFSENIEVSLHHQCLRVHPLPL